MHNEIAAENIIPNNIWFFIAGLGSREPLDAPFICCVLNHLN